MKNLDIQENLIELIASLGRQSITVKHIIVDEISFHIISNFWSALKYKSTLLDKSFNLYTPYGIVTIEKDVEDKGNEF